MRFSICWRRGTCLPSVESLLVVAILSILCALPALGGPAEDRFRALAAEAGQTEHLMRIGMEDGPSLQVGARGSYRILDPKTGRDVWRPSYDATIAVVAEGAPEEGVATVYRVQVAAYSSRDAAEAEKEKLVARFGVPGVVHHDPDRGSWRVRLGEAEDREALATLTERLRAEGYSGLWIAGEPAVASSGVTLRLVDTSKWESVDTGLDRLAVAPASRSVLEVDETSYRGVFEVRVTAYGTVRAINWVGLEPYLLGVVPAELGPEVWPQLEALKAQSVAARTYAWKHRGQFEEDGYDLCATPRCQVYKGKGAEHPLSDRAVWGTRGEVLTWDGEPISALYTATCGGHTEDAANVFVEEDAPYLSGVPCRAESEVLERSRAVVEGRKIVPVVSEGGVDVTREWALLRAAGVLRGDAKPKDLERPVEGPEFHRWLGNLASIAGRDRPQPVSGAPSNLGEAATLFLRAAGWEERAEVFLADADLDAVLRSPEAASLPLAQKRALAYLVATDMIAPGPGGRLGVGAPPSRARMLPAIHGVADTYRVFGLKTASVVSVRGKTVRLFQGKSEIALQLDPKPFLFGRAGDTPVPVSRLVLYPGDKVSFRTGDDGRIDFVELARPVNGLSDDRISKVYSWQVRRTGRDIEAAVNRRVDVGRLRDLQVVRRGVSGRIAELRVVGDRATTVVKGFDIRRMLGLSQIRDTLVVIELEKDRDGRVRSAVFTGKGWGHGVGLCQVGAYGMALRGEPYRVILAHYYRGATLETLD